MDDQANQDLATTVTENFAKQNVQVTRRVELQIPVAVFTAHRGYDWSKLPDFISRDEADSLFEKIMSVKTVYCEGELPVGDAFKGVLYTGGMYAFAFRLMTAEKWDQAKRNANYCACAFVPRDKFKDVDFERLLDMEYFSTPSHNPPATLDYYDEDFSAPALDDCNKVVCNFKDRSYIDFDWRLIGSILSVFDYVNDKWFFARINARGENRFVPEFGNWNEDAFMEYPVEGGGLDIGDEKEIQEERLPPDTGVSQTDTFLMQGQTPVCDIEIQQPEPQRKCTRDGSSDAELTNMRERLANLTTEYNDIRGRFEKLSRNLQTAHQERDDAKRACHSLQYRIKTLEVQSNSKSSSTDLLPLLIAFLLGVALSGVIFLAIQLLTSHGGNDASTKGVSHSAVQSVEALQ